jgi:hypothetical protein
LHKRGPTGGPRNALLRRAAIGCRDSPRRAISFWRRGNWPVCPGFVFPTFHPIASTHYPGLERGPANRPTCRGLTGETLDWAHGLVEAGLALVDAGTEGVLCQPELLALEATARERHLGVWADDRYKPLDANQSERLRERIGSFVLVEGRIRSIGERKQRVYLNFGGLWAEDFTIIIPKTTWKQMSDRGLGADALKGRRIRARGILQPWQGTAFSIVIPDMIERLDGDRLPR